MIEVILLIVGISYAVKRPKLKRLTVQDYPGVDPTKFIEWQTTELKATDIFLWATWGAFVVKLAAQLIIMTIASNLDINDDTAIGIIIAILVIWLIGLTVAAVFGSKAKKLRQAAGIQWPKKS